MTPPATSGHAKKQVVYPRWFAALHALTIRWKLRDSGLIGAAVLAWISFMPSLLPRVWYFQGLITGISLFTGYVFAIIIRSIHLRYIAPQITLTDRWRRIGDSIIYWSHKLIPFLVIVYVVIGSISAVRWHDQSAALVDASTQPWLLYLGIPVIALAVLFVLLTIGREVVWLIAWVSRFLQRTLRIPRPAARFVGIVSVVILALGLGQGVVLRVFFEGANILFSAQNDSAIEGVTEPAEPERSGSPASVVDFEDLGMQGRRFVDGGLRADELSALLSEEAKEPIRLYSGIESASDDDGRAALVVDELNRTRAWERESVAIVPTTGTGWINPNAAQAIELLGAGDTAIVGTQYSFLPSWISFLADQDKARSAGNALISAVAAWRDSLPADAHKPKLYVYGESLGTLAGEGAFSGLRDIRSTVDGVLWMGPPNSSTIWNSLVSRRDPGTTEVEPTYADGLLVRFSENPGEFREGVGEWLSPRILYVQHATDPVVWWNSDLLFQRPDWLEEEPGEGRHPDMTYLPIGTFWQVTADLGNAVGGGQGYGHLYDSEIIDGWATITERPGWDEEAAEKFQRLHDEAMESQPRG